MNVSFWTHVYRLIVCYDIGVFLELFIKIIFLREHACSLEFINAALCITFAFYFWKKCEWEKIYRR